MPAMVHQMMFSENAGIGGGMPTETSKVLLFTRLDVLNDIHAGQSSGPVLETLIQHNHLMEGPPAFSSCVHCTLCSCAPPQSRRPLLFPPGSFFSFGFRGGE